MAGATVGSYIITRALKYNMPKRLVLRMLINQAIDSCVGVVPFLGDIFDFGECYNCYNMRYICCSSSMLINQAIDNCMGWCPSWETSLTLVGVRKCYVVVMTYVTSASSSAGTGTCNCQPLALPLRKSTTGCGVCTLHQCQTTCVMSCNCYNMQGSRPTHAT
jgi:hypothetical protein